MNKSSGHGARRHPLWPLNYGMPRSEAESLAREAIEKLSIEAIQGKIVHYLSVEKKRRLLWRGDGFEAGSAHTG